MALWKDAEGLAFLVYNYWKENPSVFGEDYKYDKTYWVNVGSRMSEKQLWDMKGNRYEHEDIFQTWIRMTLAGIGQFNWVPKCRFLAEGHYCNHNRYQRGGGQ